VRHHTAVVGADGIKLLGARGDGIATITVTESTAAMLSTQTVTVSSLPGGAGSDSM